MNRVTVLTADRLVDGTGAPALERAALVVEDGLISRVAAAGDALPAGDRVSRVDLGPRTLLPGLINCHVHLCLPGDGTPFEEWMTLPDELLLLTAARNAQAGLRAGVTTLRDCGGKGRLTFRLRDGIARGILAGPTLVLCGRPLTITGGHCHPFGGEADGVDGMRAAARQLLKEGADFIKMMASGGGTLGTYPQHPSYTTEELRAATAEAQAIGKRAAAHCIATASIFRSLEAGVDGIEHASCYRPDMTVEPDPRAAEEIAARQVYVTATLQVGKDAHAAISALADPTPAQRAYLAGAGARLERGYEVIAAYHRRGVPLVAGNDAGWRYTRFDTFAGELEELAGAGLSPLEAIVAATGRAAVLLGVEAERGTLRPGLAADVIAVDGDPLRDLRRLRDPALVMKDGRVVVAPPGQTAEQQVVAPWL